MKTPNIGQPLLDLDDGDRLCVVIGTPETNNGEYRLLYSDRSFGINVAIDAVESDRYVDGTDEVARRGLAAQVVPIEGSVSSSTEYDLSQQNNDAYLTLGIPVSSTPPPMVTFYNENKIIATIEKDGTVNLKEEGAAPEAARLFWESIEMHGKPLLGRIEELEYQLGAAITLLKEKGIVLPDFPEVVKVHQYEIIVNGEKRLVDPFISYAQLAPDSNRLYTVTYSSEARSGSLTPGEVVGVVNGMIFNVSHTGNA